MACATRRAAPMSVSLASWLSCAKMRSSWTRWKSGTASSARRCDTSCTGVNFSRHCGYNPVDYSHGLKIFPDPRPCEGLTAGFRVIDHVHLGTTGGGAEPRPAGMARRAREEGGIDQVDTLIQM